MSLVVTQRPDQFNKWVATGNPILYKMTRKDYNITAVANSGGALQITVNANLATLSAALGGPVIAGSILYVQTDNGIYAGSYTVVTCTNAANSVVTMTAGTYSAAATTGFINLTSNRTGYYVETELYRQTDNTLIFSALKNFPSPTALVQIDVSLIGGYLDQEPFAYLATTTNGNTLPKARTNTTTSLGFYIKYREVWTGSAEAQTNDSANPSWAVKATRQIGEAYGAYLKEYSEPNATPTRKFLTKVPPTIWAGRKFTLSFIDSEALATPRTLVKKTRYNTDLTVWGATYDLPEYAGPVAKSIYESFEDASTPYGLTYDKQEGAGTAWTNLGTSTPDQVVLAPAGASQGLLFPLQLKLGKTYQVVVNVTVSGTAGAEVVTPKLEAWTLNGTSRYLLSLAAINVGTSDQTWSAIIPATSDTYFLRLMFTNSAGVNNRTVVVNSVKVTIPVTGNIDYQLVSLTSTLPATETVVSETLTATIKDTPDEAVQMAFKNSLGGDSSWVFGWSQEYRWRFQDGKRKRQVLFAQFLTDAEFDMLQDLNGTGEIYRPAYTELTSAINKSHARVGSQAYLIDAAGNKTGVVVIPMEIPTKSRRSQHQLQITIDMPETIEL